MPNQHSNVYSSRHDIQRIISETKSLQDTSVALRQKISNGFYDDDDLNLFWHLASSASKILGVSDEKLSKEAGLGSRFFHSVSRSGRRPKLVNFLKALTAIITVSREKIRNLEREVYIDYKEILEDAEANVTFDNQSLMLLCSSLSRLAHEEICKLDEERPNDPQSIEQQKHQRELLKIFADGFAKIALALGKLEYQGNQKSISALQKSIKIVSSDLERWWQKNSEEVIDWTVRIPFLTSGVAALNMAGANMTIGTSAMAALVGGERVLKLFRKPKA